MTFFHTPCRLHFSKQTLLLRICGQQSMTVLFCHLGWQLMHLLVSYWQFYSLLTDKKKKKMILLDRYWKNCWTDLELPGQQFSIDVFMVELVVCPSVNFDQRQTYSYRYIYIYIYMFTSIYFFPIFWSHLPLAVHNLPHLATRFQNLGANWDPGNKT